VLDNIAKNFKYTLTGLLSFLLIFPFLVLVAPASGAANLAERDVNSRTSKISTKVYNGQDFKIGNSNGINYIPDEILVKVKAGKTLDKVNASLGTKTMAVHKKSGVQKIKLPQGADLLSVIQSYKSDPSVEYAEPNFIRRTSYIPNDPEIFKQWGLDKARVKEGWDVTKGDTAIILAIIDSGIDYNHPDLQGKIVNPYNSLSKLAELAQVKDDTGHGTHVAGIAAATINNSIGIAGIGGNIKIMPIKAGNNGSFTDAEIADAIYWATDHGARVINMSLGGSGFSITLGNAVNYALNKNVVVVAAAGNESTSIPSYPAAYNGVIGVAATDQNDVDAWFSNYGIYIDISAPGTSIYSTTPTYYVPGFVNSYDYAQGTSMASPAVAGLAGLILSVQPNLSPAQVEDYLYKNAQDVGTPGWDELTGWGRIDAYKSLTAVLSPLGSLDSPGQGKTVSGTINVGGWFLDGSGVAKIEVLVDGVLKGQAAYGGARPDVGSVFPAYNNNNSGFNYSLDTKTLADGSHTITIRETGNNGIQTTLPGRTVTVSNNLPALGSLDSPGQGKTVSGTINVGGWFLDGSGVAKIEVLVDGVLKGQAAYGGARPDVGSVFPAYNNNNSGFNYSLDTKTLADGSHTIIIRETGNSGIQTTLSGRTVTVSNNLPALGSLDSPGQGKTVSGTINVGGWFLDGSGVAKIEVLVDGVLKGQAAYGGARPDVGSVFPAYNNNNSGFNFSLETLTLANGSHTISIRETGNNGIQTVLPDRVIIVSN